MKYMVSLFFLKKFPGEILEMNFLAWGVPHKRCGNGRLHVTCRKKPSEHQYWLADKEFSWSVCPHCVGWWIFKGPRGGNIACNETY